MDAPMIASAIAGAGVLGVVVWVLATLSKTLIKLAEALAAAASYVQEPTKDTVPVREFFPCRVCLRVSEKSHVSMVLGEQAFERGAWANRIGESKVGTGYVVGESIREPLRIRAGWVSDETIEQLETFVTGPITHDTTVLPFPTKPTDATGPTRGGAA